MKNEIIHHLKKKFDSIMHCIPDFNVEFWYARDLQEHLGYAQWRNFLEVIEKAKVSCMNSGAEVANHFADIGKMVKIGSGAERSIEEEVWRQAGEFISIG